MAMIDLSSEQYAFKRTTAAQRDIGLSMSEYSGAQIDDDFIKSLSLALVNRHCSSERKRNLGK